MANDQLLFYIEESQIWTCPITGRYKIICVGGGASGMVLGDNSHGSQEPGETTSFGNYVYAGGGKINNLANSGSNKQAGGYGGFNGIEYGGAPQDPDLNYAAVKNGGACGQNGYGYGAGGGAVTPNRFQYTYTNASGNTLSSDKDMYAASGAQGDIKTHIIKINKDDQIPCTVGKGGTLSLTLDEATSMLKNCVSSSNQIDFTLTTSVDIINSYSNPGNDGVIIIQYLGV